MREASTWRPTLRRSHARSHGPCCGGLHGRMLRLGTTILPRRNNGQHGGGKAVTTNSYDKSVECDNTTAFAVLSLFEEPGNAYFQSHTTPHARDSMRECVAIAAPGPVDRDERGAHTGIGAFMSWNVEYTGCARRGRGGVAQTAHARMQQRVQPRTARAHPRAEASADALPAPHNSPSTNGASASGSSLLRAAWSSPQG